jgi:parallel beta-helix repeat protein
MKKILSALLLFLSIGAHAGRVLYIAPTGSDANTVTQAQSQSTPWRTLGPHTTSLTISDTVKFQCGGTYFDSADVRVLNVTIKSYGTGAKPIITSMYTITNWTSLGNGIYESEAIPTSTPVLMVSLNNAQVAMGRTPNANAGNGGYLNYELHNSAVPTNVDSITDNNKQTWIDATWNSGAQVVIRTNHGVLERYPITNVIQGTTTTTIAYNGVSVYGTPNGYGYFVQNDARTLDQLGEWYYNPSTKKISMYFGSGGPGSNVVQVATKDKLLLPHNSNMVIQDIDFVGANGYCIYSDWVGIKNLKVTNCGLLFAGLSHSAFAGMKTLNFLNCTFKWANSNAVAAWVNDTSINIMNCDVSNIGIFQGMMRPDASGKYGTAFFTQKVDSVNIGFNYLHNIGYNGYNFTFGSHINVFNNIIDTCNFTVDDGGAVYAYTGATNVVFTDRNVFNNRIRHWRGAIAGTSEGYVFGGGCYPDDKTTGMNIYNNTFDSCSGPGIYLHNARGIIITGNKFYNNTIAMQWQHDDATALSVSGNVVKKNVFFNIDTTVALIDLRSNSNDFTSMAVWDSNTYSVPFKYLERNVFSRNWFGNNTLAYDLAAWKTFIGGDANSTKTPIPVSDASKIVFNFNQYTVPKRVSFCTPYRNVDNTSYTKSVYIDGYTSVILLQQ